MHSCLSPNISAGGSIELLVFWTFLLSAAEKPGPQAIDSKNTNSNSKNPDAKCSCLLWFALDASGCLAQPDTITLIVRAE